MHLKIKQSEKGQTIIDHTKLSKFCVTPMLITAQSLNRILMKGSLLEFSFFKPRNVGIMLIQ